MRDRASWKGCSQKEISVFVGTPHFWGSGVESPFIFYTKKKKKKVNTNYMLKILLLSLIELKKFNFDKLTLQGFGPYSYNLCKIIQSFGPSYNLPKLKRQNTNLPIQKP